MLNYTITDSISDFYWLRYKQKWSMEDIMYEGLCSPVIRDDLANILLGRYKFVRGDIC